MIALLILTLSRRALKKRLRSKPRANILHCSDSGSVVAAVVVVRTHRQQQQIERIRNETHRIAYYAFRVCDSMQHRTQDFIHIPGLFLRQGSKLSCITFLVKRFTFPVQRFLEKEKYPHQHIHHFQRRLKPSQILSGNLFEEMKTKNDVEPDKMRAW